MTETPDPYSSSIRGGLSYYQLRGEDENGVDTGALRQIESLVG